MALSPVLWTIGHSTRTGEEWLALLKSHGIVRLVDIRTIPRSRHNPQFNRDELARTLPDAGLFYTHMPSLGGLRKPKKDSPNAGWRNESFRGYADYMQTAAFRKALEGLMSFGEEGHIAIMCAEAVPWRCHRSLVADALVIRGWTVKHILSQSKTDHHRLTSFAVVDGDRLVYPPSAGTVMSPTLF